MYDGLTIANYIINWYNSMGKPIYNIRLQNLLYLIQEEYYIIKNTRLISDDFYILHVGPVIPSVQERYGLSCTLDNGIPVQKVSKIPVHVTNTINKILLNYFETNTFNLSSKVMSQKSYTLNLRKNGIKSVIPFEDIIYYSFKKTA